LFSFLETSPHGAGRTSGAAHAQTVEKNPSNSHLAKRYVPPVRESIEQHLAISRARLSFPYARWTDKTATLDWVLDLHKKRIVNGPKDADKGEGPGRGKRYIPRDYRDLLTVIRLKARGVGRRSAWVAHLWLRGHDYSIEQFRAALLKELRTMRKDVIADFVPRGLSRRMDFRAQYSRYMAKREKQGHAPESPLISYLSVWEMAPHCMSGMVPDTAGIAAELAEMIGEELPGLDVAIGDVFNALLSGEQRLSDSSVGTLMEMVNRSPLAGLLPTLMEDENLQRDLSEFPKRIRGTLDDGRAGTDTSSLITTVKRASEADFVRIRRWYVALRWGRIERLLEDAMEFAPEARAFIEPIHAFAKFQREVVHANPVFALHIFACMFQSDVPIELLEANDLVGYRNVMRRFAGN
jgi:hypothetical protein